MEFNSRFLQTVMRDKQEKGNNANYRYDLIANGKRNEACYVVRAHKSVTSKEGQIIREAASVAESLYGSEQGVRQMFLKVAYADKPVDPVHLGDVLQDKNDEIPEVNSDRLKTEESLELYSNYEPHYE